MKRVLTIIFICCCTAFVACQFGVTDSEEEAASDSLSNDSLELESLDLYKDAPIPQAADELFDDFFYSYISSHRFAAERSNKGIEPVNLSEEEPFFVVYEREEDLELMKDTTLHRVVLEKIEWEDDVVINYIFQKASGKWFLTDLSENEVSDTPNAGFFIFLRDFFTDTSYQYESLRLPIKYNYYSEEDETIIESELDLQDWKELVGSLPLDVKYLYNIDYGQSLISSNRKSFLLKGLSNGLLMKFHFGFAGGQWQLIGIDG